MRNYLKSNWLYLIFLPVLTSVAYLNALTGGFVSDDRGAILQNPNIGNFNWVLSAGFSFVQPLIYFVIYSLAGLSAPLFHLLNLFLHLGIVLLVYTLVFLLSKKKNLAWIAAAIFAVHPILTEAVTWISGVPYLLSAFFLLAGLIVYIEAKNSVKALAISAILFLLALSSSNKAIVFFPLVLVYELSYGDVKKNWKRLTFFLTLTLVFFISLIPAINLRIINVTGAPISAKSSVVNPLILIPFSVTTYLSLIFFPYKLSFYHTYGVIPMYQFIFQLIVFIAFIIFILLMYRKNRNIFFWLSFFIIALLPALTPFKIAWIVAERYVYLGSIGIIAAVSYLIVWLWEQKKLKAVGYFMFVLILLIFTFRTILRNFDWQNQDTLWIATAKTDPLSQLNHNNLGDMYGRHGDLQKALQEFRVAIELDPNYADAYHNLGNTYRQLHQDDKAIASYQKALQIDPNLWQSHEELAGIYFEQKLYKEALGEIKKAINISPNSSLLYSNLGIIYLQLKDKSSAEQAFLKALGLDPNNQIAKSAYIQIAGSGN